MTFFQKIYNLSKKGIGIALLFVFLSGIIYAVSTVVPISKNIRTALDQIAQLDECEIVEYELICNKDYYKFGNIIIDLNYEVNELGNFNDFVFTKDGIIIGAQELLYVDLLDSFGFGSNLTMEDLTTIFLSMVNVFIFVLAIILVIGGVFFYGIAHLVMASIAQSLIKKRVKTCNYKQAYVFTSIIALPYIAFNAIFRIILGGNTLQSLLINLLNLQFFTTLIRIGIDLGILTLLTLLVLKYGLPQQDIRDEVIEGEVISTSSEQA